MANLSHEEFLLRCPKDQFEFYSKYISQESPITGKCLKCGTTATKLARTFQAGKCRGCANKTHPGGFFQPCKTNEQFLKEAKLIHGDEYEYLEPYQQARIRIKLKCKKCNTIFHQLPQSHLDGYKCKRCLHNSRFLSVEDFEKQCHQIHNNQYEYFQDYKRANQKIKIKCKKCNEVFRMVAGNHKNSESGCSKCKSYYSKGEQKIKTWLDKHSIEYIQHYKFDDCKHINKLIFDFYLPTKAICIEYDGRQHFQPVMEWGGNKEFNRIKIRDSIKDAYCSDNNIQMIRIPYDQYRKINSILKNKITHNF